MFPEGQRIVFTGRLASMSRSAAVEKVTALGGLVRSVVNRQTDAVIIGADGWPLRCSGRLTRNLERADALARYGDRPTILTEAEFLRRISGGQKVTEVRRSHTIEQLSRLMGVSGLRLRRWVEIGLIRPVDPAAIVPLFDFGEVIAAKRLAKLIQRGVRPTTLVRSLQRLQHWLPHDAAVANHLVHLQHELLVRDECGRLIDASGQRHFDFDDAQRPATCTAPAIAESASRFDPDQLYEIAYQYELAGNHRKAVTAYRDWLTAFGEDPNVLFNLGNVYRSDGQLERACRTYRRCLALDRQHAGAWNNLGICLADQRSLSEAIEALRMAAELQPDDAGTCYNLADLLEEAGAGGEARLLWLRIARNPAGDAELVNYARQQLAGCETR